MVIEQLWMYPVSLSFPFMERMHDAATISYCMDSAEDACDDYCTLSCLACEAGRGCGFW